ncbi:MAG TPA: 5'-nucleotidase [Thermoanaerobaculia bacterium]
MRAELDFEQISGGEQPGEVTYSEAFSVQPFGNLNTVMSLTGAQIQRLLEQQFRADRSRQPLDPDAIYRVTVNNFLAAGGDSFDVFLEGTDRQGGGGDLEAFFAYFAAHSPVSSPGTGRILELP